MRGQDCRWATEHQADACALSRATTVPELARRAAALRVAKRSAKGPTTELRPPNMPSACTPDIALVQDQDRHEPCAIGIRSGGFLKEMGSFRNSR